MEHARHVFRVLLVLFVVVVVFLIGRTFLVPSSYGLYGSYRYDNVAEQANIRLPVHGGAVSCADCHDDRSATLAKGAHRTVSCEVCHGPLGRHVKDGDVVAKPHIDREFGLCALCHRKIEGRPASFPQISLQQHQDGEATKGKACLGCHDPHSPKL